MNRNANCMKDKTIQLFIDNELAESDRKMAEQHIVSCPDCAKKMNEMTSWSGQVKSALGEKHVDGIEFQEFKLPEMPVDEKSFKSRFSPLLKIAALLIFIWGGYFLLQKQQPKIYHPSGTDLLIWEETSAGNDANRAWHDRQITILITDENGKINYLNVN